MPELKSDHIQLVALDINQLTHLLDEPTSLNLPPGYHLATGLIDEQVMHALRVKRERMADQNESDQLWSTYWLIYVIDLKLGVGLIGLKSLPDESGYVEVGYGIVPQFRRRGYAFSALNLLTEWAFTHAECICVTASTVNNPASDILLEKAGFFHTVISNNENLWFKFRTNGETITQQTLNPIGVIHTPFQQASGTPIQSMQSSGAQGTIVLQPQFIPGLKDLEGFSHLILLYVFNLAQPAKMLVTPFLDQQTHGLFATRAPARPNPLGLSVVRLLNVQDRLIRIADIDVLNGTPLLDIKPFVPQFDCPSDVRIGWLQKQVHQAGETRDDGRFL